METQITNDKPPAVATAVKFLWISFWFGIVVTLLNLPNVNLPSGSGVAALVFISFVLTTAFTALLITKISAGRNWARITFIVLYVLGIPVWLYQIGHGSQFGSPSGLAILGGLVNLGLQGYVLFLLLTEPVKIWFRKANHSDHKKLSQPATPSSVNCFCTNCGSALTAGNRFCAGCGAQAT